jgi:hypothetical protein
MAQGPEAQTEGRRATVPSLGQQDAPPASTSSRVAEAKEGFMTEPRTAERGEGFVDTIEG